MGKKILGLDLGTTSIGWAFVTEAENDLESATIERIGVRVNPLTTDEEKNFKDGKPTSVNAMRTQARGARRNLQRYKQRREHLLAILKANGLITDTTPLAEDEKDSTHSFWRVRARAAYEKVSEEDFARILLMLNKKRGYKSSRKAAGTEDEGQAIDGMAIAKRLYEEGLTPGQLCLQLLTEGKKQLPDFYRSDLREELEKVWAFQQPFHPEILTPELKKELEGKTQRVISAIFWKKFRFNTAENKGNALEKKLQAYSWRSAATHTPLTKEEVAFVIAEINNYIFNSSGYLGAISDRSKELFFKRQTVGQYLYHQLKTNPHSRLKSQVFYRQDYLDEFEILWQIQSEFHPVLTRALKEEIRDTIIFYQRRLKSQKGLVSFCELESRVVELQENGKTARKTTGYKVSPKSSPLFQQFKIWQNLHSLRALSKTDKKEAQFDQEAKAVLFAELNLKGNLTKKKALEALGYKPGDWNLNYETLEGNRTNENFMKAYFKMMELEGHQPVEWTNLAPGVILDTLKLFFDTQNINPALLHFDAELQGKAFEKQPAYQLWHLLYSYEGDNSASGNDKLYELLNDKFGFKTEFAKVLASIPFPQEYGNLSAKAMRKIYPFIEEHQYSDACRHAGYNHSASLTREENETRILKDRLDILPKNSLRNPVVEKILNQMVNVINAIIDDPALGKPDEIRIELARELKKNAKERQEMTLQMGKTKTEHDAIAILLMQEFGIKNPTRNDIIRYKLYEELKVTGYKTLYSNTYIPREKLFSKEFDIEHIIPKALLFDDSFSNKTICGRQENLDKGNRTAFDFMAAFYGQDQMAEYLARVEMAASAAENPIKKAKYLKLLMKASDIGEGFIERDLRDSQYIAKKARQMLLEICRTVVPTTGSITKQLREDWDLVNIMQELNFEKYKQLGLTEMVEKKDGSFKERITDWTKRNDHRHHAMDALTVAFTRHNHIQYLNHLNARKNETHKKHGIIISIENKETVLTTDSEGKRKRKFKLPLANFRTEAKRHLEQVLVSQKAKNKVVTKNINHYATQNGAQQKTELTPRGQLHLETVYGQYQKYATKTEKVGAKFDEATILKVASPAFRAALLQRLRSHGNDPKKAFTGKNSLEKMPLFLPGSDNNTVPEQVKLVWLANDFGIRKPVDPTLNLEKVIDQGVKRILLQRLAEFKNDPKLAFSNIEQNPIWLNAEKGIAIKRVAISGIKNGEALHVKKDHHGRLILDGQGKTIPVDYVNTGNNHHVAIFRDEAGVLQENLVSFFEAVERVRQQLPVVDKTFNRHLGWQFMFSMKQNEYFVFPANGFDPAETDLLNPANAALISRHLFRVQKITIKDYFFRHHLETTTETEAATKNTSWRREGLKGIAGIIKVRINHIGQIVKLGEY